jgi:hypothetical protein
LDFLKIFIEINNTLSILVISSRALAQNVRKNAPHWNKNMEKSKMANMAAILDFQADF